MLFCISTLPVPLLTRAFEGAMKLSFLHLSLLLGDKLDLPVHVSCECAGEGGGWGGFEMTCF